MKVFESKLIFFTKRQFKKCFLVPKNMENKTNSQVIKTSKTTIRYLIFMKI